MNSFKNLISGSSDLKNSKKFFELGRKLGLSNKAIAEMIGNSRVKILKNKKVDIPLVNSNSEIVKDIDHKYGQIIQDTSIFEKVLETLLESNILQLEKKGIVIDERLKQLSIRKCLDEVIHFHNNLVEHNRIPFCFTFYKEVTNYCIQLLETPKIEHKNVITPRTSTGVIDRWPTAFQSCRPLFFNARDNTEIGHVCDQIIRSLLNVHRLCIDLKGISLESITDPSPPIDPSFLEDFEKFVKNKFETNGVGNNEIWNTKLNIDQSKSGPNGELAYKSSGMEAYKLLNSKRFSIPFKELCALTGNDEFYKYVESQSDNYNVYLKKAFDSINQSKKKIKFETFLKESLKGIFIRKLTGVPDSGHKARTIAIVDYWTQTILEPSEQFLVKTTLKLYPHSCDYYSHSKGFDRMFKRLRVGDKFYDCSLWTDRFPVELQEIVHKMVFNPNITKCWMDLVVKCPWNVKNSTQTVRYSRGQGMGTRGSFQIAQLTSCLLMDYIFVKHYKIINNSKLWGEVGDDMGCHDPDGHVLETYKFLNIPINLSKTKIATKENLCMEYVSRNVNFGKDVSRISARNCQALDKNLLELTSLALHISERTNMFDYEMLFNKLRSLKTSKGNPRWKFLSWIILYKTLVINDIVFPNEILGSIVIPLNKSLRETTIVTSELDLYGNIKVNNDISLLLKLAVLENICKKISSAADILNENHIEKEGNPFPPIDSSLVDTIVRNSMNEDGIPSKFPWSLLPDVNTGCATYHYMLSVSNQNYHKFSSEFFGSGILDGKDFTQLNLDEQGSLLDLLEGELSKILISMTPKQVFSKRDTNYNKTRLRITHSYSLLKHFSSDKDTDQIKLKFKYELELFKELYDNHSTPIEISQLDI